MAYQYNVAYRFKGELEGKEFLEGFTGTAMTGEYPAMVHAIMKIKRKCEMLGETFEHKRVIHNFKGMNPHDKKRIQDDWKISARSEF